VTSALLDRFESKHAEVPSLWHLESANALLVGARNGRIAAARTSEFIALVNGLPIVVDEQTPSLALDRVLNLAQKEGLSAYDASYLELAMRRGLPLATMDGDLAAAARRVGVSLLETG
jgi:predicted nucleic acid-binding protein